MLIWRAVGPSGRNKACVLLTLGLLQRYDPYTHLQDYLYQLADSMRALAPASCDAHLFTLEVGIRFLPLAPLLIGF